MTLTYPGAVQRWTQAERAVDLWLERGRLRLAFLAETVVRVRFTPNADFAPRRSWAVAAPDEEFGPVPFEAEEDDEGLTLRWGSRVATVQRATGQLAFRDEAGRAFAADAAPIGWGEADLLKATLRHREGDELPEGRARVEVCVTKAMADDEGYYGFGERTGLLDRRGRRMTNWTIDPDSGHARGHDNLYQAHPVFLALRPGLAWGCFLNVTWYSQFDVGARERGCLDIRAHGGELDYYLFCGPTPAAVVADLTQLTGRPLLPPLWALGYHQSRWGYRSADEMRELAAEFRARDIPLDVLHFDIDYMNGYRDFAWHPERFPDPAGLIAELGEQGVRAVPILDPGVKYDLYSGYEVARDGLNRGVFIRNPDGTPFVGFCWPDAALFPDFARADARAWWGEQHAAYLDAGVAGIWNDMNEPAIFDRPFSVGPAKQLPMPLGTPQGEGDEATTHAEVHNVYGLGMCRATDEALRRLRPDRRPWILTRSAFTGIQRHAVCWMGDNNSWWEHLELSLPQLASMGLGGVPHVGVDIGGFFDNPSAELYARWVELGTFYPFMRTHSCEGTARQEPWSFGPEVEGVAREAIRLRYRLLPYLVTLAHEAHRAGTPLFRPLFYDFPDDPATFHRHDQIMVGPHLMVAPVYHPGVEHRMVYLPQGAWYDFWSGKRFEGPAQLTVHAPLGRIPVYVRGGAALPLGNARRSTMEPLTELTLHLYPAGESAWSWVEDDGETMAYERGEVAETTVHIAEDEGSVTVRLDARRGPFQPHPRTLALALHLAEPPKTVTLDGIATNEATWDEEHRRLTLGWQDDGQAHEVKLEK